MHKMTQLYKIKDFFTFLKVKEKETENMIALYSKREVARSSEKKKKKNRYLHLLVLHVHFKAHDQNENHLNNNYFHEFTRWLVQTYNLQCFKVCSPTLHNAPGAHTHCLDLGR